MSIFQEFFNDEIEPIECRYVFPLVDSACVCGFEAHINGKHIKGICEEKQKAQKDYKQAVEQGNGAYLLDQESAELFK